MKTSKLITILLVVLVAHLFSSCSNDDKDNQDKEAPSYDIIGTWICTETSFNVDPALFFTYEDTGYSGFEEGFALIFFDSPFVSANKLFNGKKCFALYSGEYTNLDEYTLARWDENVEWYDWDGERDQTHDEVYTLIGNQLTVYQSDLDRWYGTITVSGNEMTFTYKYQNWDYNDKVMTEEDPAIYISKFRKL